MRNLTEENLLNGINDGLNFRNHPLELRCNEHNILMTDRYLFKHLRKCNNTAPGGKSKLNNRVNFDPVSIHMTATNIRELIFRKMRIDLLRMNLRFSHSIHILRENQPILKSKRVPQLRLPLSHVLVAEIPNFSCKVYLQDLPYGARLFEDAEAVGDPQSAHESAGADNIANNADNSCNMAIYAEISNELSGININSVAYSVETVLGKVSFT